MTDDHTLAAELATAAGELLLRTREEHVGIDPKELKDLGDKVSHDFLMAELAKVRPDDAVLSEEGADDHARLSDDDADGEGDDQEGGDVPHQIVHSGWVGSARCPRPRRRSRTRSRASSMLIDDVSRSSSASVGASYGALTPVKSLISPAWALA